MSAPGDGRARVAAVVAVLVLVADQVTKALVQQRMALHETIELLPGVALTYVRNPGAAFGVLSALPAAVRLPLFVTVTVVATVVLVSFLRRASGGRWLAAAVGGILGGALGNLICRVRYGAVVDFVDLSWGDLHWPAFNVADSAITVGVGIVLLGTFRRGPGASEDPSARAARSENRTGPGSR